VIFVSSDRDQAGFDGYYGEMPWLALPYSARDVKSKLSEKFGVQGIPMLVVLDGSGELITAEGRGKHDTYFKMAADGQAKGAAAANFAALFGDKLLSKQ
jgi:hypothetical protein